MYGSFPVDRSGRLRAIQRGLLILAGFAVCLICAGAALADQVAEGGGRAHVVGTGDGLIHIIPTLSDRALENGERVVVGAVIKSADGVARVTADIAGIETLELQAARVAPDPGATGLTFGQWSATWQAHDVDVPGARRITIEVTDRRGHTFSDDSLTFQWQRVLEAAAKDPEPLATNPPPAPFIGRAQVGTQDYPDLSGAQTGTGGLERLDAARFPELNFFATAVVDDLTSHAYFGTSTSPGWVVKVELGDNQGPPRLAESPLQLGDADSFLQCGVIDPASNVAYFGTFTSPARIVGIQLNPMTYLGSIPLSGGNDFLWSCVYDAPNQVGYFGTDTAPGRIVKVDLDPAEPVPTELETEVLQPGEDFLHCAVLDTSTTHAYFGTYTEPGRVVKVRLGGNFGRVGGVTLEPGENYLSAAAIDQVNQVAWFGTDTEPARVIAVRLGGVFDDLENPTRLAAGTLISNQRYDFISDGYSDSDKGYLYFSFFETRGNLVKLEVENTASAPVLVSPPPGVGDFTTTEGQFLTMVDNADFAYLGSQSVPGLVVKAAQGRGDVAPRRLNALTFPLNGPDAFTCAVLDDTTTPGIAYFGTFAGNAVSPTDNAYVVKVLLGDETNPPVELGRLELTDAELLSCAVIDTLSSPTYAYFGTYTRPGEILKVALGAPLAPPTLVDRLTLNAGDDVLATAVIDTTSTPTYAYFGTDTSPGRVIKVDTRRGVNTLPAVYSSLVLPAGLDRLRCSAIDAVTSPAYAVFGTGTSPGRVIKMAIGPTVTPTFLTSVQLAAGDDDLRSVILDPINDYAYFGTRTRPGRIVKVDVGATTPARLGATELLDGEDFIYASAIELRDPAENLGLFATRTDPSRIIAVGLPLDDRLPLRRRAELLEPGEAQMEAVVWDTRFGLSLWGSNAFPGRMVQVSSQNLRREPWRRLSNLVPQERIESGEETLSCAIIDPERNMAYFGTWSIPARIIPVYLGRNLEDAPRFVASNVIELQRKDPNDTSRPFQSRLRTAVIDPVNKYGYFGTETAPAWVVKVKLGTHINSDPTTAVNALLLEPGEDYALCSVIDTTTSPSFALFGTFGTTSSRIVKLLLGDGDSTPTRVGSLPEVDQTPITDISTAIMLSDPASPFSARYAYFGTDTAPGRIYKVRTGARNTTFSMDSDNPLILNLGEDSLRTAVIDGNGEFGYFGTHTDPGRVVKVNLRPNDALPPERVGALRLNSDELRPATGVTDSTFQPGFTRSNDQFAYFATWNTPSKLVKVRLGDATTSPTRVGMLALPSTDGRVWSSVIDLTRNMMYVGTSDFVGKVVRVALGQSGFVKAMRVVVPLNFSIGEYFLTNIWFYSFAPVGNLRFAIYDDSDPRRLMWRSGPVANNRDERFLYYPLHKGVDGKLVTSPTLARGNYWLAWQTDTAAPVASYLASDPGPPFFRQPGFSLLRRFSDFPNAIASTQYTTTSENWTIGFTHNQFEADVDPLSVLFPPQRIQPAAPETTRTISITNYGTSGTVNLSIGGFDNDDFTTTTAAPPSQFVMFYGDTVDVEMISWPNDIGPNSGLKQAFLTFSTEDPTESYAGGDESLIRVELIGTALPFNQVSADVWPLLE